MEFGIDKRDLRDLSEQSEVGMILLLLGEKIENEFRFH